MNLSNGTTIQDLERAIVFLRKKEENLRQKGIDSRKSFYEKQANIFGRIMTIVYKLELIHCRATPFDFTRGGIMLDFKNYDNEAGLERALVKAIILLDECIANEDA